MICLVTGFGGFPGAPRNPTEALVAALARRRRRLALAGIDLRLAVLPVRHDAIAGALEEALAGGAPDVILHFGLAARRRALSLETRARNRAGLLRPDAAGRCAARLSLDPEGPAERRARWPAARLAASLRRAGFDAAPSNDAGDYLCNELLYLSLARTGAACVGFAHAPAPRRIGGPAGLERAALALILAAARLAPRRPLRQGEGEESAGASASKS